MPIRAFVVSSKEILAHPSVSLSPTDYDSNSKRTKLEAEAKKLRGRAATLTARAAALEAEASTLPPNRPYITGGSK